MSSENTIRLHGTEQRFEVIEERLIQRYLDEAPEDRKKRELLGRPRPMLAYTILVVRESA